MTKIVGSLASVNSVPTEGTAIIRALKLRPGSTFVVTGEPKTAVIRDGSFTIEDVDPGPAQVTIQGNGATHDIRVQVPDEESVTLLDLLDEVYDWEPEQVSAVRKAAREARAAADDAKAVADYFGDVSQVKTYVEDAKASSDSSSESANAAAKSASEASSSATVARGHSDSAREAAEAAEDSRDSARQSVETASEAANDSKSYASQAKVSADSATSSAAESGGAAAESQAASEESRRAANNAQTSESKAAESANEAKSSADSATKAASAAANNVRGELSTIQDNTVSARDEAIRAADDSRGSADRSEQAAKSAEAVVSKGVPNATDKIAGAIRLTGDLGGTYDSPTVPELKNKVDSSLVTSNSTPNTIAMRGSQSQIAVGLEPPFNSSATSKSYVDDRLYDKMDWSEAPSNATPVASKLVRRSTDSQVQVPETPSHDLYAASKKYVDSQVAGMLGSSQVDVEAVGDTVARRDSEGRLKAAGPTENNHVSTKEYTDGMVAKVANVAVDNRDTISKRPALFSGKGKPPKGIDGAQVGDMWLDTEAMDIYRITGV